MRRNCLVAAALACGIALSLASDASATTIAVTSEALQDDPIPGFGVPYRFTFTVSDRQFDEQFGFRVLFDPTSYTRLELDPSHSTPASWDVLLLQPDAALPDFGAYDAAALLDDAPLAPFSVIGFFQGAGPPGSQSFEIFDPTLRVIETGMTIVPEPSTGLLVGLGMLGLGARRRGARAEEQRTRLAAERGRRRYRRALVALLVLLSGSALTGGVCGGPVVHEVRFDGFTIRYFQVAKRQIDRRTIQYVFEATFQNDSAAPIDASAVVHSNASPTVIVDGDISFGTVPPGGQANSADSFTIAQDRTVPFDPDDLVWLVGPTSAVDRCREQIFVVENMIAADELCQLAVTQFPADGAARLFRASTRLLRVFEEQEFGPDPFVITDSVKEMMDAFGVSATGRSIYACCPALSENAQGDPVFPDDSPEGPDTQVAEMRLLLGAVEASILDLQAFPAGAQVLLTPSELAVLVGAIPALAGVVPSGGPLEVDLGDVRAYESSLQMLRMRILVYLAVNAEIDIDEEFSPLNNFISVQNILDRHPNLGRPGAQATPRMADAGNALRAAIDAYMAASAFVRTESDDQTDDFITLEGQQSLDADAEIRGELAAMRSALDVPTRVLVPDGNSYIDEEEVVADLDQRLAPPSPFIPPLGVTLDLYRVFYGSPNYDLRAVTPLFNPNNSLADFPDPNFGGALLP